jgi:hypothetical protein
LLVLFGRPELSESLRPQVNLTRPQGLCVKQQISRVALVHGVECPLTINQDVALIVGRFDAPIHSTRRDKRLIAANWVCLECAKLSIFPALVRASGTRHVMAIRPA